MNNKVFFIAEAGKNFIIRNWEDGSDLLEHYLGNAMALALQAKNAGADAIKFQTHVWEDEHLFRNPNRSDWIKFNQEITPIEFWEGLKQYCDDIKIEFMSTPMSALAAKKICHLVKRWKVGSGNVTDYELLKFLGETGKPVILSTGMSTHVEVETALNVLKGHGAKDISLLYCKSVYPTIDQAKLPAISQMKEVFGLPVGYSDHSLKMTGPMIGVIWGATIIEKHFTLDKTAYGPDHKISLEPYALKWAVKLVRDYEGRDMNHSLVHPVEEEIELRMRFNK